ncbi:hypothetical protein GCM10011348_31900 [Marinobacterium nitratireducens]|uniref:Uncharacterized protein n=1 Tax=Marinobacterium nitratireducens TaxID=518897 RepID=A0A917ZJI1_9GAMM|nr:hypothetical protein [Marinobacterium nitratireducens]GGO84813.1 hypothetical protein GCM10011348_31900 [Marinobacterium nitratireducens]
MKPIPRDQSIEATADIVDELRRNKLRAAWQHGAIAAPPILQTEPVWSAAAGNLYRVETASTHPERGFTRSGYFCI